MVLLGPFYLVALPFVMSAQASLRAWSFRPRLAWRVFTVLSLQSAAVVALAWPLLIAPPPADTLTGWAARLAGSYLAWSLTLMPQALARAIYAWRMRHAVPT
jgi:hypothetical protein